MIEILTIAGVSALVGSLGEHVFGHILHDRYSELERHVWNRLPDLAGTPKNHDIARAIRTAQLQAIALTVRDFKNANPRSHDAVPVKDAEKWREANRLDWFVEKVQEFTRRNLAIGAEVNLEVTPETVQSIQLGKSALLDALRQAQGSSDVARDLKSKAEEAVLNELREYVGEDIPPAFAQSFNGEGPAHSRSWFDAFSVCLARQVKEDEGFRAILEVNLLGDLTELGLETRNILHEIDKSAKRSIILLGDISTNVKGLVLGVGETQTKLNEVAATVSEFYMHYRQTVELLVRPKASLFLTAWGNPVRSSSTTFNDPYQAWPPVKVFPDGHLDLEFGPFLLADQIFMDKNCYEYLLASPPPGLERAIESLKELCERGFLFPVDYHLKLAERRSDIIQITKDDASRPVRFRGALRDAFRSWSGIVADYTRVLDREGDPAYELPLGIHTALAARGHSFDPERIERLKLIASANGDPTADEMDALTEMVRPYLEHVHTHLALSKVFDAPIMDWEDTGPIYRSVLSAHLDSGQPMGTHISKVRELFSVSLAALEPSSVSEFLKVVRDPSIIDFRNYVVDAAHNRVSFNGRLAEHLNRFASAAMQGLSRGHTEVNVLSAIMDLTASEGGIILPGQRADTAPAHQIAGQRGHGFSYRNTGWLLCLVGAKKTGGSGETDGYKQVG